jgi:hypothetical protein
MCASRAGSFHKCRLCDHIIQKRVSVQYRIRIICSVNMRIIICSVNMRTRTQIQFVVLICAHEHKYTRHRLTESDLFICSPGRAESEKESEECSSGAMPAWNAADVLCACTGTAGLGPDAGHCSCPASCTTTREKALEKMILRPPDCRHTLDIMCKCAMRSDETMALKCCSLLLYCMRTGSSGYDEWSMYSRQGNVAGLSAS